MNKKRKPVGRPDEGREKLTLYVLPATASRIRSAQTEDLNTLGKVVDEIMRKNQFSTS